MAGEKYYSQSDLVEFFHNHVQNGLYAENFLNLLIEVLG